MIQLSVSAFTLLMAISMQQLAEDYRDGIGDLIETRYRLMADPTGAIAMVCSQGKSQTCAINISTDNLKDLCQSSIPTVRRRYHISLKCPLHLPGKDWTIYGPKLTIVR